MSDSELSRSTVVFGLRLWVLLAIAVGAASVLLLVLISILCFLCSRRRPTTPARDLPTSALPSKNARKVNAPEGIQEAPSHAAAAKMPLAQVLQSPITPPPSVKEHRMTYPEEPPHHSHRSSGMPSSQGSTSESADGPAPAHHAPKAVPEVSHLGWGHWYTLEELETATGMFADENVIGEGGYGIVYHGVLENGTQVGVKNLLNNRYSFTYYSWNLL